ncbi:NADH-quinone oxidoreductase subunit J [uncultured Halovibrio sp.]|uniref:NADH-quinone oxidoreductase subunit J n=1 Tax=uncultured Halovibrio sp. TaxID=985049 RepID=UPI0025EA8494|nr:NADH-quinone oxidoreductase subunit J [uncultured Halovibrio sp.]
MALLESIAFALFALVTVGSSLGVVMVRDVWHSALFLGVSLLSVAVYYVMLRAEFLAAMQILVYVGGVLILITFAIMLTERDNSTDPDADVEAEGDGEVTA